MSKHPSDRATRATVGTGALVLAVCCGSHLLAFGAIGALVAGGVFGVLAGVIVAGLVAGAVLVVVHRRRQAPSCAVARPTSAYLKGVSHER